MISCVTALLDYEQFEVFRRFEQFREPDLQSMVSPRLLTKEHHQEDRSSALGVDLAAPDPTAVGCGKSEEPQNLSGRRDDEQQGFEALGACVAQCESETTVLEVANGLLAMYFVPKDSRILSSRISHCYGLIFLAVKRYLLWPSEPDRKRSGGG